MEAIWEKLSKPLPPSGVDPEPIVTPELRHDLTALLSRYEFEYLAEGRANVVFSIRDVAVTAVATTGNPPPPPPPPPQGQFQGTLLRVPKTTPGVTPCDYETLQRFHEEAVERRVGRQHVVPQILVSITRELADRLDASLRRDSTRNSGDHHDDQDGDGANTTTTTTTINPGPAMLVQDMGPSPAYPLALEFKPKWLAQSPLAPRNATRCRSCAREALRNAQKIQAATATATATAITTATTSTKTEEKPLPAPPVCRLGLVHDDPAVFRATVDELAAPWGWSGDDRARLAAALKASGVLRRIRELQVAGDPDDTLLTRPGDAGFGLAMTLRDCSCFVRMTGGGGGDSGDSGRGEGHDDDDDVVIKLADVDKKNWEEKQTYWQESHWNLVKGGWYEGREEPPMETHCLLGGGGGGGGSGPRFANDMSE